MSTCSRLDLETLGSQLVMPKNLPESPITVWVTKPMTLLYE